MRPDRTDVGAADHDSSTGRKKCVQTQLTRLHSGLTRVRTEHSAVQNELPSVHLELTCVQNGLTRVHIELEIRQKELPYVRQELHAERTISETDGRHRSSCDRHAQTSRSTAQAHRRPGHSHTSFPQRTGDDGSRTGDSRSAHATRARTEAILRHACAGGTHTARSRPAHRLLPQRADRSRIDTDRANTDRSMMEAQHVDHDGGLLASCCVRASYPPCASGFLTGIAHIAPTEVTIERAPTPRARARRAPRHRGRV